MTNISSMEAYASENHTANQQYGALLEGLQRSFQQQACKYSRVLDDQQDLTQAAMVGVARALPRYKPGGDASLMTYLYNCGVNAMINKVGSSHQSLYQSRTSVMQ